MTELDLHPGNLAIELVIWWLHFTDFLRRRGSGGGRSKRWRSGKRKGVKGWCKRGQQGPDHNESEVGTFGGVCTGHITSLSASSNYTLSGVRYTHFTPFPWSPWLNWIQSGPLMVFQEFGIGSKRFQIGPDWKKTQELWGPKSCPPCGLERLRKKCIDAKENREDGRQVSKMPSVLGPSSSPDSCSLSRWGSPVSIISCLC